MPGARDFLRSIGLPAGDLGGLPDSAKRFPDGAQYRVEIPSTEGPRCLDAVLEEAERLGVRVHRVSQGSGVFLHTDEELDDMAARAAAARVEVSLFTRPNAAWGTSATARAPAGGVLAPAAHGQEQVVACLDDARRAAEHGFRSVLIADLGVLWAFNAMKDAAALPADMQAKISVMLPAANPIAARGSRGSARARSTCRPTSRWRRSRRSGPPSTAQSTSTSRRPTTSAASSGTTSCRS